MRTITINTGCKSCQDMFLFNIDLDRWNYYIITQNDEILNLKSNEKSIIKSGLCKKCNKGD